MSAVTLSVPSSLAAPKMESKRRSQRSMNAPHPAAESLKDLRVRKEAISLAARLRPAPPAWLVNLTACILGVAIFLAFWAVVANLRPDLPGPVKVWHAALKVFANPFYVNGPNDQGIGWNVLSSLQRVAIGFALAACVGIPLGFLVGRFAYLSSMVAPIISLLRPVSPLAWLPIGLLVFQKADPAATWTIFICSIWPMILNTAAGVRQVPRDYLNVARVLDLSEWKIFTKILLPAALPHVLTGVRLSIGVAWLVIVAAEMLTGGVGIGFWVWDEWNNLKVEHIIIAILVIGVVGLALEYLLILIARRFSYGETQ